MCNIWNVLAAFGVWEGMVVWPGCGSLYPYLISEPHNIWSNHNGIFFSAQNFLSFEGVYTKIVYLLPLYT